MKKTFWIVILIVVVTVLGVVIFQQQQDLGKLRAAVAKPVAPAAAPPHMSAPVVKAAPAPPVTVAVAPPPAESPAPRPGNMFARIGEMTKDPAFKDMIKAQQKMMLGMQYASLFKSLNLGPEDLENFKQLLSDRQGALMEGGMAMMGGALSASDRAQKVKELEQVKAGYDQQIAEFLGADDYAVFKQYEETQSERMQVSLFKQSLSGTETLTEEQEADLIAALYQERQKVPNSAILSRTNPDPSRFTGEGLTELQKVTEQLHEQYVQSAATILSETQLEQFKKSLEQQRAMQTMGLKMAERMFAPPPPAARP